MNTRSNRELLFGHSLTHSARLRKSWGNKRAAAEHARVARKMRERGLRHRSPYSGRHKRRR